MKYNVIYLDTVIFLVISVPLSGEIYCTHRFSVTQRAIALRLSTV